MVQPLTLAGGNSEAVNTTQKVKREAVSGKSTQNEKTVLFIAFWHRNSGVSTVLHFPVLPSSLEICCRGLFFFAMPSSLCSRNISTARDNQRQLSIFALTIEIVERADF